MIVPDVPQTASEITRFIEQTYHVRHREELPRLAALAAKVERVHADSPDVPAGLAELLHRMTGELEVHMKKEELILFPAIRNGGAPGIENPIAAMRGDHDEHGASVSRILDITLGLVPPEDACGSWRALYAGLASFVAELEAHIRLENEVLFPPFGA